MNIMKLIFGDLNEKEVKKLSKIVDEIEAFEPKFEEMTDEALKQQTAIFRERLDKGETLDDLLTEAFAVVREAGKRVLGVRAFRSQLIGGIVLHQGRIAEMKTGEGKTLTATLPVYLNALEGKGVHVVTVNDYLAYRDKEWMGRLYEFLGMTVGCVIHGVEGEARNAAYRADITYGTNNEFGFDYLRDNMVMRQERLVQLPLNYAIVDEVDSILVDEARTPLIISGESEKSTDLYQIADHFAAGLNKETDVNIDEKAKSIALTDGLVVDKYGEEEEGSAERNGVKKAENYFKVENLSDPENLELSHHINQAIRARFLMRKDVDYIVKDGEVIIVDEFTGRLMYGRRYSNGLHQAIEAKEGIEVRKESQTLATITLQNYFRMYKKLAGMTGTAKTEEDEFRHIYNMDVVVIPTNKPIARVDLEDGIYKNFAGKFGAVLKDIEERHAKGQPMLVGTISIETSEYISSLLKKKGIKHEVLNAKQHDREAEIVAQAGRFGALTIATNMAGRGTDIVLGGNPEFMAKKDMLKKGLSDHVINMASSPIVTTDPEILEAREIYNKLYAEYKVTTDEEAKKVKEVGGLHIIGTERHESRRIDNQLRGRSGRQGDPGSSQFYISFEDDLMRLFVSDRAKQIVETLGLEEDMQLENKMLTKAIENAQKKVEGRNFGVRKHVLQYDDVMNKQREIIYGERNKVLHGENIRDNIISMIEKLLDRTIPMYTEGYKYPEEWDLDGLLTNLHSIFLPQGAIEFQNVEELTLETLKEILFAKAKELYAAKEIEIEADRMREVERAVLLRVVDMHWIDHIDAMDQLKQGISLRAIGQQDPVIAYKMEGFDMFEEMIASIQQETIKTLFHATLKTDTERKQVAIITGTSGGSETQIAKPFKADKKIGRNEPCPCGSGKKYKKCHGLNE
ncbi:preprotein translocase subunit SecA [Fusibacter ferrireducens]|uniref:Protein translocase subunit SecA n=1 Tax=Fusibacter ferrireducens TaxID=2785058 RepID=A0ABR9ZVW7_9FIRM|nr:preprotein translocase subunit SecA [Fusibacter ferrireducens]MBF4694491.1 preprotein translocase subunit SecA [Fusibacter ferrireducens]